MSSATATPPRAKRPKAERVIDPATVCYDDLRSTKFNAVYLVPSQSEPGSYRRVTLDEATGVWSCSCPATVTDCAHCRAAKQSRRLAWWRNQYRGVDDLVLRNQDKYYAAIHSEGTANPEDYAAWSVVGDMIAERWVA